ncbi:MAG TPA: LysR family transcriptional regulator, partial [Polyangia bacterium]|nr:LysR family transcriptional regulator [Polyangia bacterium]
MRVHYQLLQTLLELERAPSFAVAAATLRVSTSAVSQRLQQLEHQLGFTLFERFGRRNRMTHAGRDLCATVRESFQQIDESVARMRGDDIEARGTVRIGGPVIFSRMWLRPRLAILKKRYPLIMPDVTYHLAWALTEQLVADEVDLCIIVGPVEHAALESRLIYTEEFVCVAAPSYLARHGHPRTFEEFASRPYIIYDAEMWMLAPWWRAKFSQRAPLPTNCAGRISNLDEMLALTEAGVALCVLPTFYVDDALTRGSIVLVEPTPPSDKP